MFELEDGGGILEENNASGACFPDYCARVMAFDAGRGRETQAMSFIVDHPKSEPGFELARREACGCRRRHGARPYASAKPEGERY